MIMRTVYSFKMPLLYLLRNRRRTVLSLSIVAIAIFALTAAAGFGLFTYQSLEKSTANDVGHITVTQAGYFTSEEETPLENGLSKPNDLIALLNGIEHAKSIQPRVYFSGLISNGRKSAIFIGNGVEPSEFEVRDGVVDLQSGTVLTHQSANHISAEGNDDAGESGIMIAKDLARNLRVAEGDWVTLLATTSDGALNAMDFQVTGIYSTGVPEMDKRQIYIGLPAAQDLLSTERISTLSVYLSDTKYTQQGMMEVEQRLNHYHQQLKHYHKQDEASSQTLETTPWQDRAFFYHKVRGLYNGIFGVLGLVMAVVVFVALFNTMTMTVTERTREIGTLSALGSYPREIVGGFVRESMLIAIIGSAIGAGLALVTTLMLKVANVQMPPPPGRSEGYPLEIVFSPQVAMYSSVAILIICMFAAFMSARKGAKKPITEALAYV
ncbi:ABC transporter permease [Vibrio methylphosphonaticus]|uniref:ABC transporter permease n=1 Tax=Vibrio methylphosphonaticus TaxID=2946866 RepID=UPI00202A335A|nr:FtsX-like permease family protein [Vibrio methylphosphonaticus]MCL9776262.1 ABC transporter permease [Vibrio methylphosphonaticus]